MFSCCKDTTFAKQKQVFGGKHVICLNISKQSGKELRFIAREVTFLGQRSVTS